MTVPPWRPSRLTCSQLEERCLAVQPELNDPGRTIRALAHQFGVAEVTIRAWHARLRRKGKEALHASLATGRPEKLTAAQQDEIGLILDGDPRAHGFDTSGWTTANIRHVIGATYGIWLDRAHLSRKLKRWGFSYQRPALRAVERHEDDIATWVRVHRSTLEEKVAEGATLVFLDESGFSLKTTKIRTWGHCGQTPIIPTKLRWEYLSVMGAIATGGQFLHHTQRGTVRSPQVVDFLGHVWRHVAGEVVVVLDRAMIHRSKAVQAFVQEYDPQNLHLA